MVIRLGTASLRLQAMAAREWPVPWRQLLLIIFPNRDDTSRGRIIFDTADDHETSYDARLSRTYGDSASTNAFASFRSRVSNPSVNHP